MSITRDGNQVGKKAGFVAIIGRPNVGKSTLMNQMLGEELSIVSPKAQTTREQLRGILTEKRGQIVFLDTPGIHKAKPDGLNAYMVDQASQSLESADVVWYMIDPTTKLEVEQPVLEILAKHPELKVHFIVNKADTKKGLDTIEILITHLMAALQARGGEGVKVGEVKLWRISALKGTLVKELLDDTWTMLSEGPSFYPSETEDEQDTLSDKPLRYFVAEKIRRQLYLQLGEELPYSCGVEISEFKDTAKPVRIQATLFVERESQKGMVVGKAGQKIKAIGVGARTEIEELMNQQVFLGLTVKVLPEWTKDQAALKRLGYHRAQLKSQSRK